MEKRDIYEISGKELYEKAMVKLEKSKISNKNKELIKEFAETLISKGCGDKRIEKMIRQLRVLCELALELGMNTNFNELTKKDLVKLIAHINQWNLSPCTLADYRKMIVQYFSWYKDEDELIYSDNREEARQRNLFYKFIEKGINRSYKKERIEASSILTDEDIAKVIRKGCRTHREKAIIKILHESGFRIGEFLNIRLKDIVFKSNCVEISVNGKTGVRQIPLVSSMALLHKHLDEFEDKEPETYIWLSKSNRGLNKPLKYKGMTRIIKNCFKRAKCTKRHNPHFFRHSRASILAPELKETMLCEYFGWTLGSEQVRTYCHLDRKQLKSVCLAYNGIEEVQKDKKLPQTCNCGTINEPLAQYCFKCGQALSVAVVMKDKGVIDEEINKTMKIFMERMHDPTFMQKIKETIE